MIGASERRSAEFLTWDALGRGFRVWDRPVRIEPPFRPYWAQRAPAAADGDDGRKPTFLSALVRRASERLAPPPAAYAPQEEAETLPEGLERGSVVELQAHLSGGARHDAAAWADLLRALRACCEPVAFELIGTDEKVVAQLAAGEGDAALVRRLLSAHLPSVTFSPAPGYLEAAWGDPGGPRSAVVEFGLGRETAVPFAAHKGEPFVGLVSALSALRDGEAAVYQVLLAPVRYEWGEELVRSVTHADGAPRFVNAPELAAGARQKADQPLFAAVVRVAATSDWIDRSWEIVSDVAAALGAYGTARGNELVPLLNDGYPSREHEVDVLRRQSRRSGMLLTGAELTGFAHLPSEDVREPKLRPNVRKTKAAPALATGRGGLTLGLNAHEGAERDVTLSREQRARHVHLIGASGTGKSTLLFSMVMQDIEGGEGVTVLDPHGDLVDRILGAVPPDRADDVVLLDPSDEEMIVGFNILSARSDWERNMLASDLVGIFRRLSTSWGDQLNSVLHNAVLAILKSERGGTLLDLRRFLLEPGFRAEVVGSVKDANVAYYWRKVFPALPGGKSVGSVVTRLDAFLSPESIRYMVAQRESRFDVGRVMDGGKILLARLAQGAIGKENSHLLGSLLVAKIQSEAMSRQRQQEGDRRWHWVYADEFQDFLAPSLADSLTGIRKYRVGFTLAHQEMRQVEKEPDVAGALLSNAYTRVVFRVGDRDARTMEAGFASFEARDIQNLRNFEAICRVERADCDFSLSVPAPEGRPGEESAAWRRIVSAMSKAEYGIPRGKLEADLAASLGADDTRGAEQGPGARPPAARPGPARAEPVAAAHPEPPPSAAARRKPPESVEAGGGGERHRAICDRVKEAAERLGFRVEREARELDGKLQVDLSIERDGLRVAFQVAMTNSIDYEVGSVRKCIKARFHRVVVVAEEAARLAKLSSSVANSLGPEAAAMTSFLSPDGFIAALPGLAEPRQPTEKPAARTRGGRVVRSARTEVSPEAAAAKGEEAVRIISERMRNKRRKDGEE